MVTPEFSQSFIAKAVATNLEGTEALPDAARIPLQEFICHAGFQRCQSFTLNNSKTSFFFFFFVFKPDNIVKSTSIGNAPLANQPALKPLNKPRTYLCLLAKEIRFQIVMPLGLFY